MTVEYGEMALESEISPAFLRLLASVVEKMLPRQVDVTLINRQDPLSAFYAVSLHSFDMEFYFSRLDQYLPSSHNTWWMALVILERLEKSHSLLVMNAYNVHRLLLISLMLAIKFHEDLDIPNSVFSKVGGIPCDELNYLERVALKQLGWSCFVSTEEMVAMQRKVVKLHLSAEASCCATTITTVSAASATTPRRRYQ